MKIHVHRQGNSQWNAFFCCFRSTFRLCFVTLNVVNVISSRCSSMPVRCALKATATNSVSVSMSSFPFILLLANSETGPHAAFCDECGRHARYCIPFRVEQIPSIPSRWCDTNTHTHTRAPARQNLGHSNRKQWNMTVSSPFGETIARPFRQRSPVRRM